MTRERITVVVPTRDRAALLLECLASLARQSRRADQVVVVDDGSTVPVAAAALERVLPGVELCRHQTPQGVSAARNRGLARAAGSLLLFLDDDDLVHPRLVEEAMSRLESQPDLGAVVFGYRCFVSEAARAAPASIETIDATLPEPMPLAWENPVPAGVLETRPVSAFLRYLIPIHSCVVRRTAIGTLRFPEALVQGEDTWFWIALAARGCRFAYQPNERSWVRRHPGNTSRSRERYEREIQPCYRALLASGLLEAPEDVFLAHLKLAWFRLRQTWLPGRELARVAFAPHRLACESAFWLANFGRRWRAAQVRR